MALIDLNDLERDIEARKAFEAMCEIVLRRYTGGESLWKIAKEFKGETESSLRIKLQRYCDADQYEKAKTENAKKRLGMRVNTFLHLESKAANIIEDQLSRIEEKIQECGHELTISELKELANISKITGDKANLAQGKATDRHEITGGIETDPALREEYLRRQLELLERAKQVGTAIATE